MFNRITIEKNLKILWRTSQGFVRLRSIFLLFVTGGGQPANQMETLLAINNNGGLLETTSNICRRSKPDSDAFGVFDHACQRFYICCAVIVDPVRQYLIW